MEQPIVHKRAMVRMTAKNKKGESKAIRLLSTTLQAGSRGNPLMLPVYIQNCKRSKKAAVVAERGEIMSGKKELGKKLPSSISRRQKRSLRSSARSTIHCLR